MDLTQLLTAKQEKRNAVILSTQKILDDLEASGEDITEEKQAEFDGGHATVDKLEAEIRNIEKQVKREVEQVSTTPVPAEFAIHVKKDEESPEERKAAEHMKEFRGYVASGGRLEKRSVYLDSTDAKGGYVVPTVLSKKIYSAEADATYILDKCTIEDCTGMGSKTLPKASALDSADWTTNITIDTIDNANPLSLVTLTPRPLSKYLTESKDLPPKTPTDFDAWLVKGISEQMTAAKENKFINGTGTTMPLGFMVADAAGVTTGRDITTGSATNITYDALVNCEANLKAQNRRKAVWIFGRNGIALIRKLKDTANQPIWSPNVAAARERTLFGYPVIESEYCPDTWTTGLYVGCLCDLSGYVVGMNGKMVMNIYREALYATNSIAYEARQLIDGTPLDENKFSRLKTA